MATTQTTELQLFKPEIGGEEDTWGQLLNTNMDEIDAHAASVNTTLGTLGTAATEADTKYAHRANNLSDLQSASAARTSLGLGTAATQADTKYNHRANNLSDVANQSTARGNLGLGTAAVQNDTRYNHRSNNLSDVANTATARVNLGAHDAANLTTGVLNDNRVSATLPTTKAFRRGNYLGTLAGGALVEETSSSFGGGTNHKTEFRSGRTIESGLSSFASVGAGSTRTIGTFAAAQPVTASAHCASGTSDTNARQVVAYFVGDGFGDQVLKIYNGSGASVSCRAAWIVSRKVSATA